MITKTITRSFALLIGTLLVGCAAESGDDGVAESTESAATAASWQAVYRCDDGSTLDVNANERREIQFVVRNEAAKKHLLRSGDVNFIDWNISPAGEIVYRGRVDRGIFYPHDFGRALAVGGKPKNPATAYPPMVEITRQGSDIKLLANEYINWIFRNCR